MEIFHVNRDYEFPRKQPRFVVLRRNSDYGQFWIIKVVSFFICIDGFFFKERQFCAGVGAKRIRGIGLISFGGVRQKSDTVIVFYGLGSPYKTILTQVLSLGVAVITVFRITSGLPVTSGLTERSSPGP